MPSDLDGARAANAAFYEAFEHLDPSAMAQVWSRQGALLCVHPGWEPLVGPAHIMASWSAIFRNTGYMEVEFEELTADGDGDVVWLAGVERVRQAGDSGHARAEVAVINVFRHEPEGWRMVAHHGAMVPRR